MSGATAEGDAVASVTVAALYRYPLKSAAGIAVDCLELDARGPVGDRRWMLIDDNARFVSQRELPRMALLRPTLERDALMVDAPGMTTLAIPHHSAGDEGGDGVVASIWQDTVALRRVGRDADRWFSDFLGVSVSLVTMAESSHRQVDLQYAPPGRMVSLADGYPMLVIGAASVEEINRRLRAKGVPPVGVDRFRPNVVVSGGGPHAEDGWRRLIGPSVTLDIVKPCARCAIITVDQDRGIRVREPLATLSEYRLRDQKVFFGQNALHDRPGRILRGEQLVPEQSR